MADSASRRHIQLCDFKIKFPIPLPKLPRYPSRIAFKFSVSGVGEKVLNARGDIKEGIWEADGDVKVYENQLLTATILVYVQNSTKEFGAVTVSYSQLLAYAEARSKACYEFTVDGPTSSFLILVTCSITALSRQRKQHTTAEPVSSLGKSKSDKGHIGSNRVSTLNASSTFRVAELERDYSKVASLPAQRKSQALNDIGRAYQRMYNTTYKTEHLERAISILGEALLPANIHRRLPKYLKDLIKSLIMWFEPTGSHDNIEEEDTVHIPETSNPNKYRYIFHQATELLVRLKDLEDLGNLQNSIPFLNKAVRLVPDGHRDKPLYFESLGDAFQERFDRLNRVEDLEMAIAHAQKAIDLTPEGHTDRLDRLYGLGIALGTRFRRLGRIEDLEMAIAHLQRAVDLTPDGDSANPNRLLDLGIVFQERFDRLGRIEDLEMAIAHKQKSIDLMSDDDPDKPFYLNSLGISFKARFLRLGRIEDLEVAITHAQNAVDLTQDDHPDKPAYLDSLGVAFETRFNRLGRVEDLEAAISHAQKAVILTPDGQPDKPGHLNNLAGALMSRFRRLGRIDDLEMAITHHQNILDLTPDDHPDKQIYFRNLGIVLKLRFKRLNRVEDLEMSIKHQQRAVDLTPDGHPDKPGHLCSLGRGFESQFDRLGRFEDLEMGIVHLQKAVELAPDSHPQRTSYLIHLGLAFEARFHRLRRSEDLKTALIQYSTAASLPTGGPKLRLDAARSWAHASELLEWYGVFMSAPLEPYHIVVDLLPRIAWLGIPMSTQHALLEEVGGTVRDAVSAAIRLKEYEIAVEWAEAGRSIAWQNLLNLRTPASELRSAHYDLAEKLENISRQLDMSVRGSDVRMNSATDGMEELSRSHVQLALDWDNTVVDIRSKPGFESFLKPRNFNQLRRIARDGPVVVLNIAKDRRCDALVLIPEDNGDVSISNISLSGFSYAKGEALFKELKGLLSSKHLRARDSRKPMRIPIDDGNGPPLQHILRCLWIDVVKPVIDALAYQPRSIDLPRIWWCATGPLAFLPIHAAGLYDTNKLGSKLSDYVVSSYTPTLSAMLDDSNPSQEGFKLLAIAQANAPGLSSIPMTEVEVTKIETLAKDINVTTMTKEDATVENVWRGMETSNWVHLACHGQQNIKEPMKSGLLLHDGTLELQRLIEKPLPLADFAFLSACQTATGDESVAEESLHLAAGMLFAGYKGVIATMWSIMDDVGPRVAEDVYRVMLKDGKPNRRAAAHALHEAVRRLREDPKVDMLHWVPFIHIGL